MQGKTPGQEYSDLQGQTVNTPEARVVFIFYVMVMSVGGNIAMTVVNDMLPTVWNAVKTGCKWLGLLSYVVGLGFYLGCGVVIRWIGMTVGRVYRRVVLGVPMRQDWEEDLEGQYPRSRYPRGYEMQNLCRRE